MPRLMLKNVRVAFAKELFTASAFEDGGALKYSGVFILPPDHPQYKELEAAFGKAAEEKWPGKGPAMLKAAIAGGKGTYALRDGDTVEWEGFPGNMFFKASNQSRPTLIDRSKNPVSEEDDILYSGAMVNVSVDIYGYQTPKGAKGIAAGLRGVQFFKDADRLSGGGAAKPDEFEEFGDEEHGEDFA